jgi:hypothetical protein
MVQTWKTWLNGTVNLEGDFNSLYDVEFLAYKIFDESFLPEGKSVQEEDLPVLNLALDSQ